MIIIQGIIVLVAIVAFYFGYKVGIKHESKYINVYGDNEDSLKYPKEVEETYCKQIGYPIIFIGIITLFLGIFISNEIIIFPVLGLYFICFMYLILVPNLIVKLKLKKLTEKENNDE